MYAFGKQENNIFKNKTTSVEQMLESIQRLSWNWLSTKSKLLNISMALECESDSRIGD